MKRLVALNSLLVMLLSGCAHFGLDSEADVAAENCYAYRYGDKLRRINFNQPLTGATVRHTGAMLIRRAYWPNYIISVWVVIKIWQTQNNGLKRRLARDMPMRNICCIGCILKVP